MIKRDTDFETPRCPKCGAEITTGLMAVFCPYGKACEFYVPEVEDFKRDWNWTTEHERVLPIL